MNLQNVPMNLQNFITARTKQRNLTSCEHQQVFFYKKSPCDSYTKGFCENNAPMSSDFCGIKNFTIFKQQVPTGHQRIGGVLNFSTFLADLQLNLANSTYGSSTESQHHQIEKKTPLVNFQNVSINNINQQNTLLLEAPIGTARNWKYKTRGHKSPLNLIKVRSGRLGTDTVGIAHENTSQTMGNGPPLYSLLAFDSPSSTLTPVFRQSLFSHLTISSSCCL